MTMLLGFTFDDCVPFSGDETSAPIRFNTVHLHDLPTDVPLMLHFEITSGEIFGFEWVEN